ncbi:MAG: DUF853 family protein, partial [Alphaproteobacteria bacterium]|nr:DUF853 family protein [Alphaproteobacteria bacterium]
YTPREQKAVQTAASTFRPNPAFKTDEVITQLGKGEALVSVLDEKGVPSMVERTLIRPPSGRMGPISPEERDRLVKNSPLYGQYEQSVDRESAYERLQKISAERAAAAEQERQAIEAAKAERAAARAAPRQRETATERFVKNVAGSLGTTVARSIGTALVRGILGGLTRR